MADERWSAPTTRVRREDGRQLPMLAWALPAPALAASTASVGGGIGPRDWVINAHVASDYARTDLAAHGAELAAAAGLDGTGVVMLTAAKLERLRQADVDGVRVWATVGISTPAWAAAQGDSSSAATAPVPVGTINIVVALPVRLTEAALLGALCTVTEAKTQALVEAGVPGTGTPSDAVTILCPPRGAAEVFAGTRSRWGRRLADATHAAVAAGIAAWHA